MFPAHLPFPFFLLQLQSPWCYTDCDRTRDFRWRERKGKKKSEPLSWWCQNIMKYSPWFSLFFSVVVQHVSWQGNQFISAKKIWSKNESINLFEQTSVKFSLKNNAISVPGIECGTINKFFYIIVLIILCYRPRRKQNLKENKQFI